MYIVLNAMKSQGGFSDENFIEAMSEIVVPVTMTSVVNMFMFGAMYFLTDIGAIFDTALAALISVVFLLFSIIFCYPAYCYLDMKRQESRRCDILVCIKSTSTEAEEIKTSSSPFYNRVFLAQNLLSTIMQALVVIGSLAFFAIGAYGISHRERGVGLQVRCFVLIFRQCIICSLTVPSLNVCYRPS